jgi:16S rRNA G966 N2-methylase RsmD
LSHKSNTNQLKPEINLLVQQALNIGVDAFIYQYKSQLGDLVNFVATQANLHDNVKRKLPALLAAGGFVSKRSLEQASSEKTAQIKSEIWASNKRILSLCAGLGIDDIAFAKNGAEVLSIDADEALNDLFKYNAQQLGIQSIERHTDTAEHYLETHQADKFDLIYLDPDRRLDDKRQILLSEHSPNVVALQTELFKIAPKIVIKCSPMYDYEMALKELKHLAHFYSISVQNEMKELLIELEKDFEGTAQMTCIESQKDKVVRRQFDGLKQTIKLKEGIGQYFIETFACINKLRQQWAYAQQENLMAIQAQFGWFSSMAIPEQTMGRVLIIKQQMPFNTKSCKSYLKTLGITKANIKTRGLKFNTQDSYKSLQIKEGGEDYIFITQFQGSAIMLHCTY